MGDRATTATGRTSSIHWICTNKTIAQANLDVNGVETIFLMTAPKYGHISSSIVRDLARNNGDYSKLIP